MFVDEECADMVEFIAPIVYLFLPKKCLDFLAVTVAKPLLIGGLLKFETCYDFAVASLYGFNGVLYKLSSTNNVDSLLLSELSVFWVSGPLLYWCLLVMEFLEMGVLVAYLVLTDVYHWSNVSTDWVLEIENVTSSFVELLCTLPASF